MWKRYAAVLPANPWNWIAVWRRNYMAWKKAAIASILGNLAEPVTSLFGLGFGLGAMVGRVDGIPYVAFLAAGMVATSAMISATFETIHATFARMHAKRTWESALCTQLTLGDIVLGELAWAASKALLAGTAMMLVAATMGFASWPSVLFALPVIALTGFAFASLAMIVTALAPSYDYFIFYQTLFLTPMLFLSGAVFPVSQLPDIFQKLSHLLPLSHSIELIRPAMLDRPGGGVALHISALCIFAVMPFFLSVGLLRRRLMS